MKLNKTLLRRMIREAMAESDEKASKLTTRTMTGGQFVAKGREDRVDADPEVDNNERARSLIKSLSFYWALHPSPE